MHLRFWVYRRNLSNNPQSPFRSNLEILRKTGCCISGFLGIAFLGLALMCLFSPQADKDGKLFLIFIGLFGIFELICFVYCCMAVFRKYCANSSNSDVEDEIARTSLLSSKDNSYQEVPGYQGIANYQACTAYPEVPSYQIPSYQAGPSYRGFPSYQPAPCGAEGGYIPGYAYFPPMVNYEAVLVNQEIKFPSITKT